VFGSRSGRAKIRFSPSIVSVPATVWPYPSTGVASPVVWQPRQNRRLFAGVAFVSPRLLHRWSLLSCVLLFALPCITWQS
jgi:hypothetical protein